MKNVRFPYIPVTSEERTMYHYLRERIWTWIKYIEGKGELPLHPIVTTPNLTEWYLANKARISTIRESIF